MDKEIYAAIQAIDNDLDSCEKYLLRACEELKKEIDARKAVEAKVTAIVIWLEENQPDVFRRGLWDAINHGL